MLAAAPSWRRSRGRGWGRGRCPPPTVNTLSRWHVSHAARICGWVPGRDGKLQRSLRWLLPVSVAAVSALGAHVAEEALYPPNYSINAYGADRVVVSTTMALDSAVSVAAVLRWGWGRGGLRRLLAAPEVRMDSAPRCRRLLAGLVQHGVMAALAFAAFFIGSGKAVPRACAYLMLGVVVDDVLTSMMVELFAVLLWTVHDRFKALNDRLSQSLFSPRSPGRSRPPAPARAWGSSTGDGDTDFTDTDRSREVATVRRLHKSGAALLQRLCEEFSNQLLYRCLSLCCCVINFIHYHVHVYTQGTFQSTSLVSVYGVARSFSTAVCVARAISAAVAVTREGNRVVDVILECQNVGHLTQAERNELRNFSTQLHQSPVSVKMMRTIALDLRLVVGAASTTAGYVAVLLAFDQP